MNSQLGLAWFFYSTGTVVCHDFLGNDRKKKIFLSVSGMGLQAYVRIRSYLLVGLLISSMLIQVTPPLTKQLVK